MTKYLRHYIILSVAILLVACSSQPPKQTPLDPTLVARLHMLPLDRKLPIPVQGVKARQLTDTWGASRSHGRTHEGIDILAARGTKVYSATDGIVRSMRDNKLGGKVIWILGPAGSWHYYAHLDQHKKGLNEGDFVRRGDHIGYVGNTGNARHTAPHLHYGIYLDGCGRGPVNPYPYLR